MLQDAPRPVDVSHMMQAREGRALRQRMMLATRQKPLVSFTLNIPGPIKNNPLITQGFNLALGRLENCLAQNGIPVIDQQLTRAFTGDMCLLACDADALALKRLMCHLEEADALGRLMDLDVLAAEGSKVPRKAAGFPPRPCLLCGQPASLCAPVRAHSAEDLYQKAADILRSALYPSWAGRIGRLAQRSLLYEALATPKPGLVDRAGSGAHRDMDIFTLTDSAYALGSFFEAAALTGMRLAQEPPARTMESLRPLGLKAEAAMLEATGGVNTHKGAIYALGILCAAAGRLQALQAPPASDALFDAAGLIASGEASRLPALAKAAASTNGLRLFATDGITGARGEAAAGFPAVRHSGLPALQRYLADGHSMNDALAFTLIHLIPITQDTNLIKRAGLSQYQKIQNQIKALLARGPLSLSSIQALDAQFTLQNLSPGGSADLLAAACFVHWLTA